MMRAMSQPVLRSLLAVAVFAPFVVVACNPMKKDSGVDAAATVTPAATTAAPTATPTPTETTPPTVAPLNPGTATTPTPAHPGTAPAKPAGDGGKTAPTAPMPTFTIPSAIPGFDAGAFKPPPGFPSTLPTFPPPPANK